MKKKIEMVVILHNIRSLYNVGSIFRTSDAAGVKKIFLSGYTPSPIDQFGHFRKKLIKVSLGAEKFVPWEKVKNTARLIDQLKKENYKIFALEQSKFSLPYYRLKIKKKSFLKIALILGNEVKGLPKNILKKSDKILEIPMLGQKESLNVSVAFGIVVFDLLFRL